eukprot:535629_1
MSINKGVPFFCGTCNKQQLIPHLLGTSTWCCHQGCNDYKRWYQNKIYCVKLSSMEFVDLTDKFNIVADSHMHDIYHTMEISVVGGSILNPNIIKVAGGNDNQSRLGVEDSNFITLGIIPYEIYFKIVQHKKGSGNDTTFEGRTELVDVNYYINDGESKEETFKIAFKDTNTDIKCYLNVKFSIISITPRVLKYNNCYHFNDKLYDDIDKTFYNTPQEKLILVDPDVDDNKYYEMHDDDKYDNDDNNKIDW